MHRRDNGFRSNLSVTKLLRARKPLFSKASQATCPKFVKFNVFSYIGSATCERAYCYEQTDNLRSLAEADKLADIGDEVHGQTILGCDAVVGFASNFLLGVC